MKNAMQALAHYFFPHLCRGCGNDLLPANSLICARCMSRLPATHFHLMPDNPVERIFYGRLPLAGAFSMFYFTQSSLVQRLLHQIKYKNHPELGRQLGIMAGESMMASPRFQSVQALVPLPLNPVRERKRGYNQATVICEGMAKATGLPLLTGAIQRPHFTETQTRKGRIERWQNMEGRFQLTDPDALAGRHVLLVDDIVTTGATLEACGQVLLQSPGLELSLATLAYAST